MNTNCFVPFTQMNFNIFEDFLLDEEPVTVDEEPVTVDELLDLTEDGKEALLEEGVSLLVDAEGVGAEIVGLEFGACLTSPKFKMNLCPFE